MDKETMKKLEALAARLVEEQKEKMEEGPILLIAKLIAKPDGMRITVGVGDPTHGILCKILGAEYERAIDQAAKKIDDVLSNLSFDIKHLIFEAEAKEKASADAGTSNADANH